MKLKLRIDCIKKRDVTEFELAQPEVTLV